MCENEPASLMDEDAELCEIVFDGLKECYRENLHELTQMTVSLEREAKLTEDPVARRDLALVQLAIASSKYELGQQGDASSVFQSALGHMHRAGDAAAPLRGIALKLSRQIALTCQRM